MTITRNDKINHTAGQYRDRYANLPPDLRREVLTPEAFREVLCQIVSKRAPFNILRSAPTYRERPLGSIFLRVFRWHGSSGQLDGYLSAKWQTDEATITADLPFEIAESIRTRLPSEPAPTSYWKDKDPQYALKQARDSKLFDVIDTTAIVVRGGSPAGQRWAEVLR